MKPSTNPFVRHAISRFLGVAFAVSCSVISASAATYYWDANGATANGTSGTGNWDGSAVRWNTDATGGNGGTVTNTVGAGDNLIFSSGSTYTGGTITVSTGREAASLTFEDTGTYILSGTGSNITLHGANGLNYTNGAGTYSISSALILAASTAFTNSASTTQTISGGVTGAYNLTLNANSTGGFTLGTGSLNNGGTITNSGTGTNTVTISGVIGTNVTGLVQNSSSSLLVLSAANTFSGGTTVKAGTIRVSNVSAFGTGAITLGDTSGSQSASIFHNIAGTNPTIANAIVLASGNTGTLTVGTVNTGTAAFYSGGITGTNNVTLAATNAASVTFSTNSINNAGTVTGTTGLGGINISSVIGSNVTGVIQDNSAAGILTLSNNSNAFGGGLSVRQGRVYLSGSTAASTGAITLGTVGGTGAAGIYTSGASGSPAVANAINLTSGSLGELTIGHFSGSGVNNTGTFSGAVTLGGNTLNLSNISGGTTSTLTLSGAINGTGTITNTGTSSAGVSLTGLIGSGVNHITQNSFTSALGLSNTGNIFTGNIYIRQGRVNIGGIGAASNAEIFLGVDGGTNAASFFTTNAVTLTNNVTLAASTTAALTIGHSSGSGATWSGNITLNGQNLNISTTASGTLTLNSALIGSGTITGTGTNGTAAVNSLLSSSISTVTQNGLGGVLSLANGANNFGNLYILAGAAQGSSGVAGATPLGTGTVYLGSSAGGATAGATLRVQGGVGVINNAVVLGTTTGVLTLANANTSAAATFNGGVTGTNNLRIQGSNSTATFTIGTADINHTGALLYESTGTGALIMNSVIGANVTGVTQNSATSTFILNSNGAYSGPTNITAGTFHLASGATLGNTAVNASTGATFLVSGNSIVGATGNGSVNMSEGSTLSLVGGSINTLTVNSATPGATALNLGGAASMNLNVELLGAATDSIVLGGGLLANVGAGGVVVNTTAIGALTSGSYNIISAAGGLNTGGGFSLNTSTGNFGGNTLSISSSATAVTLNVTAQAAAPPVLYFNGVLDTNFGTFSGGNTNNSNFSSTADGLTDAHAAPDAGTELHLQAANLASAIRTITLGRDISVKSLFVDNNVAHALTLASGSGSFGLTIAPTLSTEGITVNSATGGTVAISAPVILGGSASVTNNTLNAVTLSGGITGTGNLTFRSNGAVITSVGSLITVSGTVNHAGSITNAGTGTATGTSGSNPNTNTVNISGSIGGNVTSILQNSAGTTLSLTGSTANTFTGLTTLSAGTLNLGKSAGVTAIGGNLLITGGNLAYANNSDNQIADTATVTMTGGTFNTNVGIVNQGFQGLDETFANLAMSGTALFNAGNNLQTNGMFVTGNTSITGGAGAAFYMGSGGIFSTNSLTLTNMSRATSGGSVGNAPSNAQVANGVILYGNNAKATILAVGAGGLTMNGTSSLNHIVLRTGTDGSATGSKLSLDGDVTTTGTFASVISRDTGGGTSGTTTMELSYTNTGAVNRTFNIGGGGADFNVNVSVTNGASSAGSLIKTGAGIMRLNAANSYTGTTEINAGTLFINAANSGTGAVNVASGGTLAGVGSINGGVTVNGTHSVGNPGIGTQTFNGSLTYGSGSTFSWDLGSLTTSGAGTSFDSVVVSGSLAVNGGTFRINLTNLNLNDEFWSMGRTWNVFDLDTPGTGTFALFELYDTSDVGSGPVDYSNYGSFSFSPATGSVSWSAVPEPTNALAGALIAAGLLRRRRKA